MVSSQVNSCPMVQLYCSEQIAIPESFPNLLKTYAKAAIRTQPYDLLRWSAAYFRCLANNAPPPAKIRLERDCRQGSITKGYLKVLIAQVGKGFFISRCLLQEHWKALCLAEDDLLKYLSLCRMLNWPQVHWLKVLAVMIGSLNETPNDSMAMLCELLTDDADGGLARIPYWMFKICYTFVAKLECSQEQCFVNGRLVLPWGDLEDETPMEGLPRVLSASLLKDTIITSCKAKFDKPSYRKLDSLSETLSESGSVEFLINSHLTNPKDFLDKCDEFDTIILLLQDTQNKSLKEEDFKGPHYISETQLKQAQENEETIEKQRQKQANQSAECANKLLQHEALQLLNDVGPPWTWLHQFTRDGCNTASYNFIDQESIISDITPEVTSEESFNFVKEQPAINNDNISKSSGQASGGEEEEIKSTLESLKSFLQEAEKHHKCDLEKSSSVISFLKSEDSTVLQLVGEPFKEKLNLPNIINILEQAENNGVVFTDMQQLMEYLQTGLLGNLNDYPHIVSHVCKTTENSIAADIDSLRKDNDSMSIPSDWKEAPPKGVKISLPISIEKEQKPVEEATNTKKEITKVFEKTVDIPQEHISKMPKSCLDLKDDKEQILGLIPTPVKITEEVPSEETSSILSETSSSKLPGSDGYRQDDEDLLIEEPKVSKEKVKTSNYNFYCCVDTPTLKPSPDEVPQQFHCSIEPLPGIGPAVSPKTIEDFLAFLRVRSRNQRGLINPRNFKEERCPYMVDTTPN